MSDRIAVDFVALDTAQALLVNAAAELPTAVHAGVDACGSVAVSAAAEDYAFWASTQLMIADDQLSSDGTSLDQVVTTVRAADRQIARSAR